MAVLKIMMMVNGESAPCPEGAQCNERDRLKGGESRVPHSRHVHPDGVRWGLSHSVSDQSVLEGVGIFPLRSSQANSPLHLRDGYPPWQPWKGAARVQPCY